jgi:hypothetical protein
MQLEWWPSQMRQMRGKHLRVSGKIHLWFDIFVQGGYRYYNIIVSVNDNLNKIIYHMSGKNFNNL